MGSTCGQKISCPLAQPVQERVWVSGKVASHMFNVSERRLVALQGAGEIVGYLDKAVARGRSRGEWVYLASSIHEWRLKEAGHDDISKAVADAAHRLGL